MSIPISSCYISKAALGDEETYQALMRAMRYNWACGHWSTFGCQCNPPCPAPSEEQMKVLNDRLAKDCADVKRDEHGGYSGYSGIKDKNNEKI